MNYPLHIPNNWRNLFTPSNVWGVAHRTHSQNTKIQKKVQYSSQSEYKVTHVYIEWAKFCHDSCYNGQMTWCFHYCQPQWWQFQHIVVSTADCYYAVEGMKSVHHLILECKKYSIWHWNVSSTASDTGMWAVQPLILEYKQYIIWYWNVSSTASDTGI